MLPSDDVMIDRNGHRFGVDALIAHEQIQHEHEHDLRQDYRRAGRRRTHRRMHSAHVQFIRHQESKHGCFDCVACADHRSRNCTECADAARIHDAPRAEHEQAIGRHPAATMGITGRRRHRGTHRGWAVNNNAFSSHPGQTTQQRRPIANRKALQATITTEAQ